MKNFISDPALKVWFRKYYRLFIEFVKKFCNIIMIKYYVTNLLFFWFFVLKGDENMIKISVVGAGNGGQALA